MSDFPTVVKRLSIKPARKATLLEAQTGNVKFDKYYSIRQTRPIQKVHGIFYIPNRLEPVFDTGQRGFIGYQYDFSFAEDFYILNADDLVNDLTQIFTNNADVCIRYRVGNAVTRYHLGSFYKPFAQSFLFAEQYTNQVIRRNFVIEVWVQYDISAFLPTFGTFNPQDSNGNKIVTSLLFDPSDSNELEKRLDDGYFVKNGLFVDFPEPIPTNYDIPVEETPPPPPIIPTPPPPPLRYFITSGTVNLNIGDENGVVTGMGLSVSPARILTQFRAPTLIASADITSISADGFTFNLSAQIDEADCFLDWWAE